MTHDIYNIFDEFRGSYSGYKLDDFLIITEVEYRNHTEWTFIYKKDGKKYQVEVPYHYEDGLEWYNGRIEEV